MHGHPDVVSQIEAKLSAAIRPEEHVHDLTVIGSLNKFLRPIRYKLMEELLL